LWQFERTNTTFAQKYQYKSLFVTLCIHCFLGDRLLNELLKAFDRLLNNTQTILPKLWLAKVFLQMMLHQFLSGHSASVSEQASIALVEIVALLVTWAK